MNVKPGDLAFTTYTVQKTLLVEVLEPYTALKYAGRNTTRGIWKGPCWLVRSLGRPIGHNGDGGGSQIAPIPDAWLRPISGDGITTEEVKELFSPSPAKESEKVGHE